MGILSMYWMIYYPKASQGKGIWVALREMNVRVVFAASHGQPSKKQTAGLPSRVCSAVIARNFMKMMDQTLRMP
jgi:hypothetical protein